jgi:hypothetical protein
MRDQLATADHQTATAMAKHADMLWDARRGDSAVTALETSEQRWTSSQRPEMPAKYPDSRRSPDRRGRPGPNRYPTPGLDGHRRAVTPLFASTMTNGEVKLRNARLPLRKLGLVSELCRLIPSKCRI